MLAYMKETNQNNEIVFPMRINRYLAMNNYSSRREADELVKKGVVIINGEKAKIGDKVNENDVVTVNMKERGIVKEYVYFAYNKPRGIVTHSPKDGQKSISDIT